MSSPPALHASSVNRHFLQRLSKRCASQGDVFAASDVRHVDGRCLVAQGQVLDAERVLSLQDQALQAPLELSLAVHEAPNGAELAHRARVLVASDDVLGRLAGTATASSAARDTLQSLRWGPATQLLAACTAPDAFDHAAAVSFVCAALAGQAGWSPSDMQLAALAGWLHDAGELYLAPALRSSNPMSPQDWRAYAQHPLLGRQLADQLDRYPAAVGRAVGEHHERLDGSGYPGGVNADGLSELGGLLAVAEALVGVLAQPQTSEPARRARAQVALRLLPGKFATPWIQLVQRALCLNAADMDAATLSATHWRAMVAQAQSLSACLQQAVKFDAETSTDMHQSVDDNPPWVERLRASSQHLLTAFHASGASQLGHADKHAPPIDPITILELQAGLREMRWQLGALVRDVCSATPAELPRDHSGLALLQVLRIGLTTA
ncbi:MAG: HD-GYP domain-containing protein [Burkholderiales bacterium]